MASSHAAITRVLLATLVVAACADEPDDFRQKLVQAAGDDVEVKGQASKKEVPFEHVQAEERASVDVAADPVGAAAAAVEREAVGVDEQAAPVGDRSIGIDGAVARRAGVGGEIAGKGHLAMLSGGGASSGKLEGLVGGVMGVGRGASGLALRGSGSGGGGNAMGIGVMGIGTVGRRANRAVDAPRRAPPSPGGTFVAAGQNPFTSTSEDRLSTFAVDVDTGSYYFARGFLEHGDRPPPASVRVEEWVNAFGYDYAGPTSDDEPFAVHLAAAPSPFDATKHVVRVALQGRRIARAQRKATHLTFLVDVSGSMNQPDKLPVVRASLHALVDELREDDSVALVTYAGDTKLELGATRAVEKQVIHQAIDELQPGGGTAMGSGMELAYREAARHLSDDKLSRVIVLSDGDANIGATSHEQILEAVRGWVSEGVTLSTMGFGRGNYNDHLMEQLADAGNGNYTYLESADAARRFFAKNLVGMLQVIAQDVKVQVDFNPDVVRGYRLVGYENRDVADKDFRNDKVDAGEIGAGHAVTALYEVDLIDGAEGELATLRVRAKAPRGLRARETSRSLLREEVRARFTDVDDDTRFAVGAALVAELLRGSPYVAHLSLDDARDILAAAAVGPHADERRAFHALLSRLTEAQQRASLAEVQ